MIPISTGAENAVRLMTAHVAKGLEFNHVFIIRANSNSFPSSYKEPLVDFPRELQGAGSIAYFDDKEHMPAGGAPAVLCGHDPSAGLAHHLRSTRAQAKDPTPDGFLRDLLKDPSLRPWLRQRHALEFQTDLFAEAAACATRIARDRVAQVAASARSRRQA